MAHWISYIYERFPPLIYGSLALGVALSGASLYAGGVSFFTTLLAFAGIWIFFFVLRLSGDCNSVAKDRIAFPGRPLPAGKITLTEAKSLLFLLQLLLFAYSQVIWVSLHGTAALAFLLLAVWAWLADHRFYAGKLLQRFPFFKTLLTQLYILPLVFFAVGAGHPLKVFGFKAWAFIAALYGAMLTYRLCCTLSPQLHPITAELIHFYGFRKTFYLAAAGLLMSAAAAGALGVAGLLWPVEFIVLGSMTLLFYYPQHYRGAEMTAAASLIVHAWAGIFG